MTFDHTIRIETNDRHLAHLEEVVYGKLRRDEGFSISWTRPAIGRGVRSGRSSVWLNAHTHMGFAFDEAELYKLDRAWIEHMTIEANSLTGLRLVCDPASAEAWNPRPTAHWDLF